MVEEEEAPSKNLQYPQPLARYEEVVANPVLFMTTVEKLHLAMGTKFKIPVLGRRELDLHRLFVEVTSRGGIEKILKEKRWKEVTSVFSFPPTATNASFVLRKYYSLLLFHYEQVYYFEARDWIQSSTGTLQTPYHKYSPTQKPVVSEYSSPEIHAIKQQRGIESSSMQMPSVGSPIVGIIDGKFDGGYLVTVTFGPEKLEGVLYEVTPRNNIDENAHGKCEVRRKKDPGHPNPNLNGYNLFFAEKHSRLKSFDIGKNKQMSKVIGKLWSNLNESQRVVYEEKAIEARKMDIEGRDESLHTQENLSSDVKTDTEYDSESDDESSDNLECLDNGESSDAVISMNEEEDSEEILR